MNEDVFNTSLRKFLKKVGVTSQREIEKAVRDALAAGRLKGHEKLSAQMVLTIGGVNLAHEITDEIELGKLVILFCRVAKRSVPTAYPRRIVAR
jgi:hypothetical protein